MKKILLIFTLVFSLFAESLQKLDSTNFRESLNLKNDMEVFYLLYGKYDGVEQEAYLHIKKNYDRKYIANIKLPKQDNINIDIMLDSKDLKFGLNNDMLFINGSYNGVDFSFTQDSNAKLNKIYFVESSISKKINVNDKYRSEVTYEDVITKPIILDSSFKNVDVLNKSMSNALNIEELEENLDSTLQDKMNDYGEIDFNANFSSNDSVAYIDDDILEIDTFIYEYTGGAHGYSMETMQLYDINSGEKLPSKFEEVFDINNDDEFLALLSSYLEPQKDRLFIFPIDTLPSSFFIRSDGIIFMWDIYQIAPYVSGMITTKISFDEIKDWLKDGVVKDYINKRIDDARSNNK